MDGFDGMKTQLLMEVAKGNCFHIEKIISASNQHLLLAI